MTYGEKDKGFLGTTAATQMNEHTPKREWHYDDERRNVDRDEDEEDGQANVWICESFKETPYVFMFISVCHN